VDRNTADAPIDGPRRRTRGVWLHARRGTASRPWPTPAPEGGERAAGIGAERAPGSRGSRAAGAKAMPAPVPGRRRCAGSA